MLLRFLIPLALLLAVSPLTLPLSLLPSTGQLRKDPPVQSVSPQLSAGYRYTPVVKHAEFKLPSYNGTIANNRYEIRDGLSMGPDSFNFRPQYSDRRLDEVMKTDSDSINRAKALISKGSEYTGQYCYNLAMESFLEAKHIAESVDSPELLANVYHVIGRLYLEMRNTDLAYSYLYRALEIREKYGRTEETASSMNSLALVLWLQGKLDTALTCLFNTLEIEKAHQNKDGISRAYNNIGIVFHEKKEYETSLSYLLRSLAISEEQNDMWSVAEACNNIGEVSISMGDYQQAERYLTKARAIADKMDASLLLTDNYRYMARLYKKTGRFEKALNYSEMFQNLNDSLFNRNTYTIISELTSLFEIEKREQSILVQNQKIEILQAKRKNDQLLKIILAGVIFFLVTTAVIIINRQRRIEARNRLLIEKDRLIQETQAMLMANEKSEKDRLANELEVKNRFLIDFALYIGMKNEFLTSIRDEIRKSLKKPENPQSFKHLLYQINQNLRYNKELFDLQKNVEKVNFEFIQKLMERFPGLTENERHLAILLRLNFSTKEIADLRAVSVKAVEMSRYRLRKRMGLDDKEHLTHYIQGI